LLNSEYDTITGPVTLLGPMTFQWERWWGKEMVLWSRNNTQAFMDPKFTEEDFQYIMKQAHVLDASKLEAKWRKEQVEFHKGVVALKKAKQEAKELKEKEHKERLLKVVVLKEPDDVTATLMITKLDEQLDVVHMIEALNVPKKSKCGRKAERAECI
jgi:hypothetical protein